MCVAFWSLEHPNFALILCSNRDEYLSRPTVTAHFHSFEGSGEDISGEGNVLSGRDVLAGGTWAGISRSGKMALLTNITEPSGKYDSSRGSLALSFLLPKTPSTTFRAEVDNIVSQNTKFAGFNLLLLSPRIADEHGGQSLNYDAAFVTNSGGGGDITARDLSDEERRCGGMSNGIDRQGASDWPKVKHGTGALQEILDDITEDANECRLAERLFGLLTWRSDGVVDRAALRNTIHVDPIAVPPTQSSGGAPREFYGTRLSTVVLVRRDGQVLFIERDMWSLDSGGRVFMADAKDQRVFQFQINMQ